MIFARADFVIVARLPHGQTNGRMKAWSLFAPPNRDVNRLLVIRVRDTMNFPSVFDLQPLIYRLLQDLRITAFEYLHFHQQRFNRGLAVVKSDLCTNRSWHRASPLLECSSR
jgi:hypothetical protein